MSTRSSARYSIIKLIRRIIDVFDLQSDLSSPRSKKLQIV